MNALWFTRFDSWLSAGKQLVKCVFQVGAWKWVSQFPEKQVDLNWVASQLNDANPSWGWIHCMRFLEESSLQDKLLPFSYHVQISVFLIILSRIASQHHEASWPSACVYHRFGHEVCANIYILTVAKDVPKQSEHFILCWS